MCKCAIVDCDTKIVLNVIEYDTTTKTYVQPEECMIVPLDGRIAGIGYTYDDTTNTFNEPE